MIIPTSSCACDNDCNDWPSNTSVVHYDTDFANPFNNNIQTCCTCGDCCLINQQFTLRENINSNTAGEIVIYSANEFDTACSPGGGQEATTQQIGSLLPFGSVIARNIGQNSFSYRVVPRDADPVITRTVPPGASVAITSSSIRSVELILPGDPIRALFNFNIFFAPNDPIAPDL